MKQKRIPLGVLIWANIAKWQIIKGVEDEQLAAALGLSSVYDHKKKCRITDREMDIVCACLEIEPEKLLER